MALATAEAIRDRVYALIEALTPTSLATKFLRYRNEEGADFVSWAEKNPAAALRRFQVRQVGSDVLPDVSNFQWEEIEMPFEMRIAYPQTHRYGSANAMDRDDAINQDWLKLNRAVGIYGRGNFSSGTDGSYDATPLGAEMTREVGNGVDYLVLTLRFRFKRSIS